MKKNARVGIMNMSFWNYDDAISDREVDEDDYVDYKACLSEYMQDDDNSTTLTVTDKLLTLLNGYDFFAEFLGKIDEALNDDYNNEPHSYMVRVTDLSEAIKQSDFTSVIKEVDKSDCELALDLEYLMHIIHKTAASDDNYLVIVKI